MIVRCSFLPFFGVLCFFCFCLASFTWANSPVTDNLSFSLHKIGDGKGPTVLVIGGIQGDEPGGFHAASLLATNYKISNGNLWVVPNLNFPAIIKRSRGPYGDLNRKFAKISPDDPEFDLVKRIKDIILDPKIDLVLNLHDGSGFYRPTYVDKNRNPKRWGQSVIIDQEVLAGVKNGNLNDIAEKVVKQANNAMREERKSYRVKNTKTRKGNVEMSKSLTYFVINNGKSAFGVEASKSLNKPERVYSHLNILEAFMGELGISFKRDFDLDVASVDRVIKENRNISFYDKRISMQMSGARGRIKFFPLHKGENIDFVTIDPLLTVVPMKNTGQFAVYHGNERVTNISPQYFLFDDKILRVNLKIDGKTQRIGMGSTVNVGSSFEVLPLQGYRVNVIGYSSRKRDESGEKVSHKKINKSYSVDKKGQVFRLEFYKLAEKKSGEDQFAGMILANFGSELQIIASDSRNKKRKGILKN
ncbi:MAG: succinylglutamate desuccinylase/aspartoacylase family protein [Desulfotalea sp.]